MDAHLPFLKWAGGKRRLVPTLAELYAPHRHRRLVEPFCGAAAITLGLKPTRALLSDINPHVINVWRWVQNGLEITLDMQNDREYYDSIRDRFNELITTGQHETKEAASIFYYMNRNGFNGLCRFNASGLYNTPFGTHKTVNYRTEFEEYKEAVTDYMFACADFEALQIVPGDFIYADPPYDAEFTSYSKQVFTWEDQERLAAWLAQHPGPVAASNYATERVVGLYRSHGFDIDTIQTKSSISSKASTRGPKTEILATRNL